MAAVTETLSAKVALEDRITRFDVHQIIQHAGLMVSFILLVITGVPLKYASWGASQWWIGLWGGVESTRSVHHFAAWMMVSVCVYHVLYLIHTLLILKRPFPIKMVPGPDDITKFFQELGYFLGLIKERPKWDRFNWREKFDYWAIFWGMPVMGGSGFILMYPVLVTKYLPGWVVPTALVAHTDEAMLALIWIFMVHIFFNHFSPGTIPMNTSIFTGKVSKELYQSEHPLEYDRMLAVEDADGEVADSEETK